MRRSPFGHTTYQKNAPGRKTAKSSPAARRLIRAALKRGHSQHGAARLLRLPNQAQLRKMLAGEIRDTPSMLAALTRADARAARAWALVRDDSPQPIDVRGVLQLVSRIEHDLAVLKELVKCHGIENP